MTSEGTAEITNQATEKVQVGTPVPGTGLEEEKGGAEKTYSQSEVDALLGKAGQRVQAKLETVTTERDTLKSQQDTLTTEITEAKESIESLTKEIDEMSKDDPDKIGLVKLRKEKEAEVKTAKAERSAIAEDKKEVDKWKRDQLVYKVADRFSTATGENVDMDSFMANADKFHLSDEEGLEMLAETLGFKGKPEIPTEAETPALKLYPGMTEGGAKDFSNLSPDDKLKEGFRALKDKKK